MMPTRPTGLRTIVFGRAPGTGKTRLATAIGAAAAARLSRAFLADTLATVSSFGSAVLWLDGDASFADGLGVEVQKQSGGDLGDRMAYAIAVELEQATTVSLVGSDLPTLPARALRAAHRMLQNADHVLGPTADGGFYLVGSRTRPTFGAARWSTPWALSDVRRALRASQTIEPQMIEPWYDIDTEADLRLLITHLALDPGAAPHTAAALRELDLLPELETRSAT